MQQGEAEDFAEELGGDHGRLAEDAADVDCLSADAEGFADEPGDSATDSDVFPDGAGELIVGAAEPADDAAGTDLAGVGATPQEPPGPPSTGEPTVDAALARLEDLAGRPVTEHREVFEDVHRRLRDVLGELDSRQPPSGDGADAASRPN
jgi:hypothetical protein